MKIGVLAVQGAVSEHEAALQAAASDAGMDIEVVAVRTAADMAGLAGLVMPGGESTTISRLLRSSGIQPILLEEAKAGRLAVFGTCAGMILLCDRASHDVEDKDIELLHLLDAEIDRNAFGRQKDSFEAVLDVAGDATPCVFIRAPAILDAGSAVEPLAHHDGKIVAAQQGKILAAAFHPELTPDTRMHQRFLRLAAD